MDNIITLPIGGADRTLDFGRNAILRHLGNLTKAAGGFDLFETAIWRDPLKSWEASYYFVYAGLVCGGLEDPGPDVVRDWVDNLPISLLDEIKYAGYAAISQRSIDEVKNIVAQAQKVVSQNGKAETLV